MYTKQYLFNTVLYLISLSKKISILFYIEFGHFFYQGNELNYAGLVFPITVNDQKKFEDLNSIMSVNLFGYDDDKVYPLYISRHQDRPHQIDLLLLAENGNRHYCWIKDLNKLMASYNNNHNRKWFCKRCLHPFSREDLLIKHKDRCAEFGIQRTELPAIGKNTLKFCQVHL